MRRNGTAANRRDPAGQVRIIAGSARGRVLRFDELPGLRPTGDRVRETLFNWLQPDLRQRRCLDMFAGSGALGFEAASRGAAHVVLVEQSRAACACLQANARLLGFDNVSVHCADVLRDGDIDGERFDLVFIDPPFQQELHAPAIAALQGRQLCAPGALIYLESRKRAPAVAPDSWVQLRTARAGAVVYSLYRIGPDDNSN